MTFGEEIDESSITVDAFIISIGPAFDNYFLTNLGYINPDTKYIVKYKLIENDFGENKIIRLTIVEDTENEVPSDKLFIVEAE